MDYTITSRPDYVYLEIAGRTTIQLTTAEARTLGYALENAAYAAEHKATLARQRAKRDAFLVGIRPMAKCPVWSAAFPDGETRQGASWLTDGRVAVLETALTAAGKAALNDRPITALPALITRGLVDKIVATASGQQITPAGWTYVRAGTTKELRAAVVTFTVDGNDVVLFDAFAWAWAWQATQAMTAHRGDDPHLVVFKNTAGATVAILQNLLANLNWQPATREMEVCGV